MKKWQIKRWNRIIVLFIILIMIIGCSVFSYYADKNLSVGWTLHSLAGILVAGLYILYVLRLVQNKT